jgi:hypothetical protein
VPMKTSPAVAHGGISGTPSPRAVYGGRGTGRSAPGLKCRRPRVRRRVSKSRDFSSNSINEADRPPHLPTASAPSRSAAQVSLRPTTSNPTAFVSVRFWILGAADSERNFASGRRTLPWPARRRSFCSRRLPSTTSPRTAGSLSPAK